MKRGAGKLPAGEVEVHATCLGLTDRGGEIRITVLGKIRLPLTMAKLVEHAGRNEMGLGVARCYGGYVIATRFASNLIGIAQLSPMSFDRN